MGMKHVVTDLTTGKIIEMEDIPADVDVREHLRQQMDDCPLCKEARARGEVPQWGDMELLREVMDRAERRQRLSRRRPRWRTLKRHARRAS
jgi:hypothetical protein